MAEENRWYEVGFFAGVRGEDLTALLASLTHTYDTEAATLNTAAAAAESESKGSRSRLADLRQSNADALGQWQAFFEHASAAGHEVAAVQQARKEWLLTASGSTVVMAILLVLLRGHALRDAAGWAEAILLSVGAILLAFFLALVLPRRLLLALLRLRRGPWVAAGTTAAAAVTGLLLGGSGPAIATALAALVAGLSFACHYSERRKSEHAWVNDVALEFDAVRKATQSLTLERERITDAMLGSGHSARQRLVQMAAVRQRLTQQVTLGHSHGKAIATCRGSR